MLPTHYVNDYAWKPEHEICGWLTVILSAAVANHQPSASNIDLRERLLGRLAKVYSECLLLLSARYADHTQLKMDSFGFHDSRSSRSLPSPPS